MKNIQLIILYLLLTSSSVFSFFEPLPWIIIENQTPFDLNCNIQISYKKMTYSEKESVLQTKNNQNIDIMHRYFIDEDGMRFVLFDLKIDCKRDTIIKLDELFSLQDGSTQPKIESIAFTQNSLQLTFYSELINREDRYFCAVYEPYVGVTVTSKPISMYLKCLYSVQNIICSAADAINYITKWRF